MKNSVTGDIYGSVAPLTFPVVVDRPLTKTAALTYRACTPLALVYSVVEANSLSFIPPYLFAGVAAAVLHRNIDRTPTYHSRVTLAFSLL